MKRQRSEGAERAEIFESAEVAERVESAERAERAEVAERAERASHVANGQVGDWRLADHDFLSSFRLPDSTVKVELLSSLHPYDRDARIEFREASHKYLVRNADGRRVEALGSVTGLVARFHPAFDAQAVVDKMMRGRAWPRRSYVKSSGEAMSREEILTQWRSNGEVQSARGTLMHYHIEQFFNAATIAEPHSPEFQQFLAFERDFMRARGLRPHRTEMSLFHCGLAIAGQCDLLCVDMTGRVVILDWKRSKEIRVSNRFGKMLTPLQHLDDCNYWLYGLQLNIYKYILTTEYGLDVSEMFLGVFHPTQSGPRAVQVPEMSREIDLVLEHLRAAGEADEPQPGAWAAFRGRPVC